MNILFINLGWEQKPLLAKLADQGHKIYGYHFSNDYEADFTYEDICIGDIRDLCRISEFAEKNSINAVVSDACDYSYFAQAFLSELLSIPGPKLHQAQVATNKYYQRRKAQDSGLKVPQFSLASTYEEALYASKEILYPLVLKPIDNRGSFGVFKVENESYLKELFYKSLMMSHSRLVLVEQYIEGEEYTVDGYCFNGHPTSLAVAKKSHYKDNQCVANVIKYSSKINVCKEIFRYNSLVAQKLGFNFGMIHAEYIIDKYDNIYLIEMANRGGGVYTSSLIVPLFTGIDLPSIYINDCLGQTQDNNLVDYFPRGAKKVILYFFSFPLGVIKDIRIDPKVVNDPRLVKLKLFVKPSQAVSPVKSDAHRHGFAIIQLDESEDENIFIETLHRGISIDYE
ncbi:ATP-grasp domain-containing protein [Thermosynechococcus sp. PP42]|uniref:ATP-grasp domain-containing protein n=1 Tax=Thermosynechococcus sp. PP42 TaxID=3074083 RepID=UPI00285CEE5E|nr:ATP-grasp domain-containing protein [Thermosynechococcus sp. PP42]MDR5637917.1 ATP-grasp domain-containing protein [Thermosynechococcus sp. PP42]